MATEKAKVKALRVIASREGFRRAGYAFGRTPVDVPLVDLKKDQINAIKGDPALTVVETEIDAPAE